MSSSSNCGTSPPSLPDLAAPGHCVVHRIVHPHAQLRLEHTALPGERRDLPDGSAPPASHRRAARGPRRSAVRPSPASPARATSWPDRPPWGSGPRRRGISVRPCALRRPVRPPHPGSPGDHRTPSTPRPASRPDNGTSRPRTHPDPMAGSQTFKSSNSSADGTPPLPIRPRIGSRAFLDDRSRQLPRRIVRSRTAPFITRLQDHRSREAPGRGGRAVHDPTKRRMQVRPGSSRFGAASSPWASASAPCDPGSTSLAAPAEPPRARPNRPSWMPLPASAT